MVVKWQTESVKLAQFSVGKKLLMNFDILNIKKMARWTKQTMAYRARGKLINKIFLSLESKSFLL